MFYEWHLIYLYGARILKLYCVDILWFSLKSCYIVGYVDVFYVYTMYASEYGSLLMFEMLFQVPITLTYATMVKCLFITCIYMVWNLSRGLLFVLSFILQNLVFTLISSNVFRLLCLCILSLPYLIFTLLSKNPKNCLWMLRFLNTAIP